MPEADQLSVMFSVTSFSQGLTGPTMIHVQSAKGTECLNCRAFINEVGGQVAYSGAAVEESIQQRVEAKYHQLLINVNGDSCPVHLT